MTITTAAYARAGLIGNPSDGYFGKTISFIIRDFAATVSLRESDHLEILPGENDLARYASVAEFLRDQKLFGYYGGIRLIKATIKRLQDWCRENAIALHDRSFTIEYSSNIPRLVGLAGSSAIVTATMRTLLQFYGVQIPKYILPNLILSVEKDELGIAAGLQDRVIQTYEGIVYMDFDRSLMESRGYGIYQEFQPQEMPPIYVAYDPSCAEVSDVLHKNLRQLFNSGDKTVVAAMQRYRELTDVAKDALSDGDWETLGKLMNENFDLRRSILNIPPEHIKMVETARSTGASAKFCGSGGAICGLFHDEAHYQKLVDTLATIGCTVLKPKIFVES